MMREDLIQDQAAGLRRLLQPAPLRLLPVAGPGRLRAVFELAAAASHAGQSVVVLGPVAGRLDLSDVIAGRCTLADAVVTGPAGMRRIGLAPGWQSAGCSAAALRAALTQLASPADLVLLPLDATQRGLLPQGDGAVLLVTPADRAAVTAAYAELKRLVADHGLLQCRLLFDADPGGAVPAALAQNLIDAARRFLGVRVDLAGQVGGRHSARAWRGIAQALADWDCHDLRIAPAAALPRVALTH